MSKLLDRLINTPKSIAKGLRITLRTMSRTKLTKNYPEVMPTPAGQGLTPFDPTDPYDKPYEIAPRFRGLHGLTRDAETGDHNCIGCMACANVCPDDLISMDLEKREGHNGRFPVTFTVNIGPCCFCGLCSEVCPTPMRAIVMTDLFEWAAYERFGPNLTLSREDLERNGDYEVARRLAGRTFNDDGELVSINPEEEGNPYFQFAIESGKADRMAKKASKDAAKGAPAAAAPAAAAPEAAPAEAGPAAVPPAAAAAPAAVDPLAVVREAFAAVSLPVPDDLAAFDLASLDALVEDRKLRASLKSAIVKARKAGAEAPAAATAAPAVTPVAPAVDALAVLAELFGQAGLPVPADVAAFDLESLDAIEDRKLRGSLKSAVVKARKAGVVAASPGAEPPVAAAAAPEAAPEAAPAAPAPAAAPVTAAAPEAPAAGGGADAEALRGQLLALLAGTAVVAGDAPEQLELGALDALEDRKLRGQAKSTLRRLQKALGLVD